MHQRFHTTMSRRTLTLVGLVGLAIWLGLSGGAFAAAETPQGEHVPSGLGPLIEVTLEAVKPEDVHRLAKASEDIVPNDLVGTGAAIKVFLGPVVPNLYVFTIPWLGVTLSTRVFASASEGVLGGALCQVFNVIPTVGAVQVLVLVQAPYAPPVYLDLLAIN